MGSLKRSLVWRSSFRLENTQPKVVKIVICSGAQKTGSPGILGYPRILTDNESFTLEASLKWFQKNAVRNEASPPS